MATCKCGKSTKGIQGVGCWSADGWECKHCGEILAPLACDEDEKEETKVEVKKITKTKVEVKKITKIKGSHLTQTNIKSIKAVLNAGLMAGKVGRITYFIEPLVNNEYKVKIQQVETDDYGRKSLGVSKATFQAI